MKTGDIMEGIFEKILPYLGIEIRDISLNGLGEPLLSRQWDHILNTCLSIENLNVGFITNGIISLKDPGRLLRNNLNITFSIDGASPSTYRNIRMADALDYVIKNIETLNGYKKRNNSPYPVLNAIFVVTAHNMHEMPEFIRLSHRIGISNVIFAHLVAHFEHQLLNDSAFTHREEHDVYLLEAQGLAGKLGINIIHTGTFDKSLQRSFVSNEIWLYKNSDGEIRCGTTEHWCMINYTGHVQVCCAPESLIAGDLREDSLIEIWNGAIYRKLKTSLSHSFEKTCGKICNLRQTVSLDDIRSFWCRIYETYDYDPDRRFRQPYSITELNRIYISAVEALRIGNIGTALNSCDEILKTEPLSFEAVNLKGICLAVSGEPENAAACFLNALEIFKDYRTSVINLEILSRNTARTTA